MNNTSKIQLGLDQSILREALRMAFVKLDPRQQWRNPVMFVVWVGSIVCSLQCIGQWMHGDASLFLPALTFWLWLTVLFANFAEAVAEGRGQAQAKSLRETRTGTMAKRLEKPERNSTQNTIDASNLRKGDFVLVEAGDLIPTDAEVVVGVASVDESAITGESAPVVREGGGDRSSVTGGTRVLSDWLVLKVVADPGETFLDRMISMVEGAARKKTPNEVALSILLASLTIIFLVVVMSLYPLSVFSVKESGMGTVVTIPILIALLVCLIPTTIGGLLSCIGIAGMGRLLGARVIATSGRAVEAAGDVDVLLLDKTGTITHGNRFANEFFPAQGIAKTRLAEASYYASIADETPEGRSIIPLVCDTLAQEPAQADACWKPVPFTAQTRMSGADFQKEGCAPRVLRKGAVGAIRTWCESNGGSFPKSLLDMSEVISSRGSTPLAVSEGNEVLGLIELKDIVKQGIRERFQELRNMGILTIMITGDNPRTAAAIAAEAGVDDYVAEATPESKLARIRQEQVAGKIVAMTGDGTNDAPALAQADVALAMNSGTQAAKEAGNMVDLDSNPTKLIEIVTIGKQMLMTRGSLTTFSVANDVSKYFAIIPAAFVGTFPQLAVLNVMHLGSPLSAILSAVIFNALIIIALVPLAIRGVAFRAESASTLLRRNLLIYGLGGFLLPFAGIKLIDVMINLCGGI